MTNEELKRELYDKVNDWQSRTFNHIHIDVIKYTLEAEREEIMDLIEPLEIDFSEFLNDYDYEKEYKKWLKKEGYDNPETSNDDIEIFFCEDLNIMDSYESFREEKEAENYPMWNTCFELKENWDTVIEAAKEVGCGVINRSDYFNDTIFMMSSGHSFYAAYWIPIYLKVFTEDAKKYKNINYQDL